MATVVNVRVSKSASGRIVTFLRTYVGSSNGLGTTLEPWDHVSYGDLGYIG